MTDRMRFWGRASALVVTGWIVCLLALTALHAELPQLQSIDLHAQAWVHSWERPWVRPLMLGLTDFGAIRTFTVGLALVLVGLLWRGYRHAPALLGFAISGALILNEGLKLHFKRPRPDVPWSIGDEHTYSFPSGHSLFSVVLYGTLCWLAIRHGRPWWQVAPLAVLLPIAIGTSRIFLGEHWPTDVIAGWLSGAIWLCAVVAVDLAWRIYNPGRHHG